jgi:hypothetical protein
VLVATSYLAATGRRCEPGPPGLACAAKAQFAKRGKRGDSPSFRSTKMGLSLLSPPRAIGDWVIPRAEFF